MIKWAVREGNTWLSESGHNHPEYYFGTDLVFRRFLFPTKAEAKKALKGRDIVFGRGSRERAVFVKVRVRD